MNKKRSEQIMKAADAYNSDHVFQQGNEILPLDWFDYWRPLLPMPKGGDE